MISIGKHSLRIVTAICLTAGFALAEKDAPAQETIADSDIGLAKGSVFDVLNPPAIVENTNEPGEGGVLARAFAGAPPAIPHAIEDLLPITLVDNMCVDCHLIDEAGEGEPTPIPTSHYVDLRNAPDEIGEALAGARQICVTCHVPQTGAEPLVRNPSRPMP